MGEGVQSGEHQARMTAAATRTIGAIQVTPHGNGIGLYFPPLRMAGSALMLALFGGACTVIAMASIMGLTHSESSASASMLALAFAGVFALPLAVLGQLFIAIALWSAANSLEVEADGAGLQMVRRWFGWRVSTRALPREDIAAIDSRLAARFLGAFGNSRYYRLVVRARTPNLPAMLVADSLKGPNMTDEVRDLLIEHLAIPGLASSGELAHRPRDAA